MRYEKVYNIFEIDDARSNGRSLSRSAMQTARNIENGQKRYQQLLQNRLNLKESEP